MSERDTTSKVTLLAFPPDSDQQTIERSFQQLTRSRKVVPEYAIAYEFDSPIKSLCAQVVPTIAEMTGEISYQENQIDQKSAYFAAYNTLAHFTPT